MPELVTMKCPECEKDLNFEKISMPISFTTDCDCGALLIYNKGELKEFHKYMNSKDSRWPIDGKNTKYIEI